MATFLHDDWVKVVAAGPFCGQERRGYAVAAGARKSIGLMVSQGSTSMLAWFEPIELASIPTPESEGDDAVR